MKIILGTGACGFQRVNHLLNTLGYPTSFKISPIKMQNSFEIDYNSFILNKLQNNQEILIGHFYIDYVEDIIAKVPSSRILCLKGDRDKTIDSLFVHFGFRNPFIKSRDEYSRYNLDFFKYYPNCSSREALSNYYDDYYLTIDKLISKFPNNILLVDSVSYFENFNYQQIANNFLEIQSASIIDEYKISNSYDITTSLHGGLGNNLFQIIEPLIFCEINNLPTPTFNTWSCDNLPQCNNSDKILGGHGGTWEDFNNAFRNIVFTEPKIANFDTKFMINDMFDFGILTKYRDLILEKLTPSEKILDYIKDKYNTLFKDSCSLHIRTWTSKGDVHSMPLPGDYYERALSIVDSKNVLVFTDNIQNSYNILNPLIEKFPNKKFHMIEEDQFTSLFMISMCDRNIVNISTFSFWGAFLNKKQDSNIIIPSNFGHEPNMLGNVNWIKI